MSLIISVIAIGFIIFFHELGHFVMARAFGVGVIEFSIGMGPAVFSKVYKNTKYSLRLLPFGGSCMMLSEEFEEAAGEGAEKAEKAAQLTNGAVSDDEISSDETNIYIGGRRFRKTSQFVRKPAWQRLLITLAGPFFNFILAFLGALLITGMAGWDRPYIMEIQPGFPAEQAGLMTGDRIKSLEICGRRTKTDTARDIAMFFDMNAQQINDGNPVTVVYKRDGVKNTAVVTPVYSEEHGKGIMGVSYGLYYSPLESRAELIPAAWYNTAYTFRSAIYSIKMLFSGNVKAKDVSGAVGMVAIIDENVSEAKEEAGTEAAVLTLVSLVIIISGSLGITNLLPIPALDGGRIVFLLIEMITGKKVPNRVEAIINGAGMLLLLLLMVLIMFNDIVKLVR